MSDSNNTSRRVQREVLPIPDQPYAGFVAYDAKDPDSKFAPIEQLRPPKGAPNVLIILLDDVGFGAASAFGGPCQTPTAERLAAKGLRYTRFHTTALCSPTRAALLSGRNHHMVGMGGITEIATSAPGYNSRRPNSMAPLAEILRLNGYSTAQFGKCHEVPVWEASPVGPFDRWPTGSGFEYFYGFVAGETNQWYPSIHEGTKMVEPPGRPEDGYHFMADMTDRAIDWVRQQRLLAPSKPFFMYFAPGATHAPHHVPKEWADKYKGKFDQGWDKLREETFARQKTLGVIPQECELTKRPGEIPGWDEEPAELKPVLARQMEVYAGFLEFTDHHIGRLIDALEQLQGLDDTLIYTLSATTEHRVKERCRAPSTKYFPSTALARSRPQPFWPLVSTNSAARSRIITTPSAGRTRWIPHINGPSKSRRIGAELATVQLYIGQRASRPRARRVISFIMLST
jgi:arylsulfatase